MTMKENTPIERLYNGIIKENPTFVLLLGMCPTLAVTTSAVNGLGMGLTTMVILTMSNLMISLLRKVIPDGVRMPAYIVIVASFVTIVQFLLQGFIPSLYSALGIYIPLIVVNCIILGRAEAYASKNKVIASIFDGIGMGGAVIFVITISSFVTSVIYRFILVPANITYLQTIVFILVIAALVQLVEMFLKKTIPALYKSLGVYLPLITTNCAVLGVALTNVQNDYGILSSTVAGIATAVGFTVSIVIMAGLREKIEYNDIPEPFKGMPVVLLTAGLMSIAFFGFSGLI